MAFGKIVLLSSSAERLSLLAEAGFECVSRHPLPDVESDESFFFKCSPFAHARGMCLRKLAAAHSDAYVAGVVEEALESGTSVLLIVADTVCFTGGKDDGVVVGKCMTERDFDAAFGHYRDAGAVSAITCQVEFGVRDGMSFERFADDSGSMAFGGALADEVISRYRDSMLWKGRAGGIECGFFAGAGFAPQGSIEAIRGLAPTWRDSGW